MPSCLPNTRSLPWQNVKEPLNESARGLLSHQAFLLALTLLLIAGLWTSPALAQDDTSELDYARLAAAVEQLETRLSSLRDKIDQTRFDADELVFELDFDPDAIVDFVRSGIAFHPYEGLLRGMRGTLMSRAGNSLDQSLLLAYLLKSAGFDARIVRGELDDTGVASVLAQVRQAESQEDLAGLSEAIGEIFGPEALERGATVDLEDGALAQKSGQVVERLRRQLAEVGVTLDADPLAQRLAEATATYFWVEHRAGPGDEWQTVHPVFAAGGGPKTEPLEYMADSVDDRYHHTLTVEAWIRQRQGDTFRNHRLMTAWKRPAANLHGVEISYRNHAASITPETLANLDQALDDDEILTPVFRGAPAPGAMAFDLKGQIIDPMVMGSGSFGAAGLFAELSDKMQSATESVEAREDGRPIFALDAMWLEFTLTTPSGRETRYRRYLLAPGAHADALIDKLWPLLSEHVYVVNTGSMPLDYLADRYLAAGSESMGMYKALAHKLLLPDAGTSMPNTDIPQDFGPLALYRLMGQSPSGGGVISVRHVPAIVGLRNGLRGIDTAFSAVDVVENRMLQLRLTEAGVSHDPSAALARGVWETAVETLPGQLRAAGNTVTNAFEVFEKARAQGIGLRVVEPGKTLPEALPAGVQRVLQHDLDNGFAVVLPEQRPDGVTMTAWWRIDPVSGTTLGMTADGYGQDVVEYLIEVTGIAFNMVQAIGGLMKCEKETDNVVKMCCLVEAHINNVTGLGFGSLLGATVGTAGAAVFDIVNYGMQGATGKGIGPSFQLQCDQFAGSGF